ncbi:MAG: hypothetical protein K0M60_11560 [Hydrogenophaga sp.]|nr:hypothetical protein [Hydrogenophaga sp.]
MTVSKVTCKFAAGFAVAVLASSAFASGASAQETMAPVACFQSPAKLSEDDIAAFLATPASLLTENPNGGLPLSSRVRALAGSSSGTIDAILALIPGANADQKAAIGSGLARAARACAASNPEYAALIQEKVAGVNSPELVTAFLAASNEVQTAALGGLTGGATGGGGAAGIGGGGNAGLGTAGLGGDTVYSQGSGGFSTSGSGQYFGSSNNGNGSVSPTQ